MTIVIQTALKQEAAPIISYFDLKKVVSEHAYPLYQNDNLFLAISGTGKLAAAGTLSFIVAKYCNQTPILINFGIAGGKYEIGTPFLISSISDHASMQREYPSFAYELPIDFAPLITVDQPETSLMAETLYDMEASGFFHAAKKLTTLEYIAILKVVSDQGVSHHSQIDKSQLQKHLAQAIHPLKQLINAIKDIQQPPFASQEEEIFLNRWHFTTCESHKLMHLLTRLQAIYPEEGFISYCLPLKSGKEVLNKLEKLLQEAEICL